jgi:hypothetical protein
MANCRRIDAPRLIMPPLPRALPQSRFAYPICNRLPLLHSPLHSLRSERGWPRAPIRGF